MEFPDKRATKILLNTYWDTGGWRREPAIAPQDLVYAKSHGMMFHAVRRSHAEAVNAVIQALETTTKSQVVDAFIASLGSRRLDLRSGLGTFSVARHFKGHDALSTRATSPCFYCGFYDGENDLSILNFERFKWGGVRHTDPTYIAFDLQMLRKAGLLIPQSTDRDILRAILMTAHSMPASARLGDLEKALAKVLPSNSSERRALIGILGYAGILIDPSRPDFREQFVPFEERETTPWHKDDWPYPVQWWMGSHGINHDAANEWFPGLL